MTGFRVRDDHNNKVVKVETPSWKHNYHPLKLGILIYDLSGCNDENDDLLEAVGWPINHFLKVYLVEAHLMASEVRRQLISSSLVDCDWDSCALQSSTSVKVALTEKWAELYGDRGIGFYSMHPGWAATPGVAKSLPSFSKALEGKLRTPEEGADTVVWLALQPKDKLHSGSFYFDRAEATKHLALAGTGYSADQINSIIRTLLSLCQIS
eukprot:Gb_22748 [translate_table: standard]